MSVSGVGRLRKPLSIAVIAMAAANVNLVVFSAQIHVLIVTMPTQGRGEAMPREYDWAKERIDRVGCAQPRTEFETRHEITAEVLGFMLQKIEHLEAEVKALKKNGKKANGT